MKRHLLACAVLLAACGEQAAPPEDSAREDAAETIDATPPRAAEITAIDGFPDLGDEVVDIALVPVSPPYQSRAVFALAGGGFAVADLNEVAVAPLAGPRVESIAAAPSFNLRGSELPLLFAAGGELDHPAAFVFVADQSQLLPAPIEPIAPDLEAQAVCVERDNAAIVTLAVIGAERAERWRVRDTGGDLLSAEFVEEIENGAGARGCAVDGVANAVADASGEITSDTWVLRGVEDVAVAGGAVYTAAPGRGQIDVIFEFQTPRSIRVGPGINTPAAEAPARIAASTANFGGSFGGGVVLIAEGSRVAILALDMVEERLRSGAPS